MVKEVRIGILCRRGIVENKIYGICRSLVIGGTKEPLSGLAFRGSPCFSKRAAGRTYANSPFAVAASGWGVYFKVSDIFVGNRCESDQTTHAAITARPSLLNPDSGLVATES